MTLEEAVEVLKKNGYKVLDEDFGIGVGAPLGADQGIPHGGDCKGCCPQRMGLLYQRSPFSINPLYKGVPDAHHPGYWLNQIPKKKKKKKKKRKLREGVELANTIESFENACWSLYAKIFKKELPDLSKPSADFMKGFESYNYPPTRAASAGRVARQISTHLNDFDKTITDCLQKFKKELHILKILFKDEENLSSD